MIKKIGFATICLVSLFCYISIFYAIGGMIDSCMFIKQLVPITQVYNVMYEDHVCMINNIEYDLPGVSSQIRTGDKIQVENYISGDKIYKSIATFDAGKITGKIKTELWLNARLNKNYSFILLDVFLFITLTLVFARLTIFDDSSLD